MSEPSDPSRTNMQAPAFDPSMLYVLASVFASPVRQAQLLRDGSVRFMPTEATVDIEQAFQILKDRWLQETRFVSSDTDIVLNEAYQQIIGLGPMAIPLILRELRNELGLWFWALKSIAKDDPVAAEDLGNVPRMAEAWLRWGAERGYS